MKTLIGAAALGALLLSGCGGDAEPKFEASPTPSPTSASPTPDEPEPWDEKTDAGAIAFVEHWIDLFNESTRTGDSSRLLESSSATCVTCSNFAELTTRVYEEGGYVDGGKWTVTSTSEPERSSKDLLISVDISQALQRIVESAGAEPETFPGGTVDYVARVRWGRDGWKMQALDVLQ